MDFGKPGMGEHGDFKRANYVPKLVNLTLQSIDNYDRYSLELHFGSVEHEKYGAPESVFIVVDIPLESNVIEISVQFVNKTSTRAPEALWISFNPSVPEPEKYLMDKLDYLVSPLDIVMNGSVHQHGIGGGVHYGNDLSIISRDISVVTFGEPTPFPSSLNVKVDVKKGFHYNYYNNIWGTKYIMWYPF